MTILVGVAAGLVFKYAGYWSVIESYISSFVEVFIIILLPPIIFEG